MSELHLAVALDGAGWHPAAWRADGSRPDELFEARYWLDLVAIAERGLLDLVTFEDALGIQSSRYAEPDDRTETGDRLQPKRADEQLCPNCFLLVRANAPGCPVGDDACPIFG